MFDYETLKLIWWLLVGVLLVGFAVIEALVVRVAVTLGG